MILSPLLKYSIRKKNAKKKYQNYDKELVKQILLEEKNREKEEKRLAKQKIQDEKK